VVIGAGPIGLVTVLAAVANGCSRVVVSDIDDAKLDLARQLGPVTTVNVRLVDLADTVASLTDGWGADVVYECSGDVRAAAGVFHSLRPGGTVVYIGIPLDPISYDVAAAQVREARVEHVFRYAHVYPRCVAMLASGSIDVAPLITRTFPFDESVEAIEMASQAPRGEVKMQIVLGN
jgi:D-xylulose reductase